MTVDSNALLVPVDGSPFPDVREGAAMKAMIQTDQAAPHLGVSISKMRKMRMAGDGPPFHKIGRKVVYDVGDLEAWLASRRNTSTAGRTRP